MDRSLATLLRSLQTSSQYGDASRYSSGLPTAVTSLTAQQATPFCYKPVVHPVKPSERHPALFTAAVGPCNLASRFGPGRMQAHLRCLLHCHSGSRERPWPRKHPTIAGGLGNGGRQGCG